MPPENPTFIVRGDDGDDYGPVDLAELRDWVRENRAGLGTTVRLNEPDALWQPWQYYPELVALLAETRATATGPLTGVVLAPMGRRMAAFLIDLILAYILIIPILLVVLIIGLPDTLVQLMLYSSHPQAGGPPISLADNILIQVLILGGIALYMAGFHGAHGKTPGKQLLRLRVVNETGHNPSLARALARGLVLSFSIFLYLFPLLYVFLQPQRRALHDLLAGTCVVEG